MPHKTSSRLSGPHRRLSSIEWPHSLTKQWSFYLPAEGSWYRNICLNCHSCWCQGQPLERSSWQIYGTIWGNQGAYFSSLDSFSTRIFVLMDWVILFLTNCPTFSTGNEKQSGSLKTHSGKNSRTKRKKKNRRMEKIRNKSCWLVCMHALADKT